MPCAVTHLALADRLLAAWCLTPNQAPIRAGDPAVRRAFLHGSLAPDMGFLPGVERFVSELAHYHDPAELPRTLLRLADSPEAEAFAWGWAAHVIADVKIHPLVGRAVGERLFGDRERRVNAVEDLAAHVGTEVGLDLALLEALPTVSLPPRQAHFDADRIRHFVDALGSAYGLAWSRARLLRDHHRSVGIHRLWPSFLRWVDQGPTLALPRIATRLIPPTSPAFGLARPLRPPEWLLRSVLRLVEGFPQVFAEETGPGMSALENRNLETGEPSGPGRGHPPSDEVVRRLDAVRASTADRQSGSSSPLRSSSSSK